MNPCIVFKHAGTAFIARVTPECVAEYTADPKQFKKLVSAVAERVGYDTDWRLHEALPIGGELMGEWVASSPMGQESTNPPIPWRFEERIKNALSLETHSLMIMPQVFCDEDLDELEEQDLDQNTGLAEIEVKAIISQILGDDALVEVRHQKVRDAISDFFDSWDGGTC